MENMTTKFKFCVDYWEYERGWSRIDSSKEFDTYEEAVKDIEEFNSRNKEQNAPDWYMIAKAVNFKIWRNIQD